MKICNLFILYKELSKLEINRKIIYVLNIYILIFFQHEAKIYRTGLKYTELMLISQGDFKRPKVWSSTRMCLYEWDMLDRFLSNAKYFEIPHDILTTAKMYCIVMFCLKLILKIVQKVDTSYDFMEKFVLNKVDNNYGKKFMKVGLLAAEEAFNSQEFNSLEIAIKRYSDDRHMTSLLLHLKNYLKDNRDKFSKEADPIIRHTRSNQQGDISLGKKAVDAYIENLCVEVQSRLKYSDCSD